MAFGSKITLVSTIGAAILLIPNVVLAEESVWQKDNEVGLKACKERHYDEAKEAWLSALKEAEKSKDQDAMLTIAKNLSSLAKIFDWTNQAEAESLYNRVLELREQALGPKHPEVAKDLLATIETLAEHLRSREPDQIVPLYERCLDDYKKAGVPDEGFRLAQLMDELASRYALRQRDAQAEALYKRALAIYEKSPTATSQAGVVGTLVDLGRFYRNRRRYPEAEAMYNRALSIEKKVPSQNNSDLARLFNEMAILYKAQGKFKEAEKIEQRAKAILSQQNEHN